MTPLIVTALAAVILFRVINVVYLAARRKHRHPLLFIGFGYSYVVLGAGAITATVALCTDVESAHELALWLLLLGSCGLIAFDRRASMCFTSQKDCPLEGPTS